MEYVIAFGVFDLLHPGHDYFIRQCYTIAANNNLPLVLVVTKDCILRILKPQRIADNEQQRINSVRSLAATIHHNIEVTFGDDILGAYAIFDRYRPKIVCCGHDQHNLKSSILLRCPSIDVIMIGAYEAHIYSSTIIRSRMLPNQS
jgi:glycerol-3-phosphate cytidylyltransferase-like family protein